MGCGGGTSRAQQTNLLSLYPTFIHVFSFSLSLLSSCSPLSLFLPSFSLSFSQRRPLGRLALQEDSERGRNAIIDGRSATELFDFGRNRRIARLGGTGMSSRCDAMRRNVMRGMGGGEGIFFCLCVVLFFVFVFGFVFEPVLPPPLNRAQTSSPGKLEP